MRLPRSGTLLRLLQGVHLSLLVAVPVLYALLLKFSEPYDDPRKAIDVGIVVLAAIWAGLVGVSTARYGKSDTLKERLVGSYRQLLQRRYFLLVADVVLLAAFSFLAYQLLGFRQIEFYSEEETLLSLNNEPGNLRELGILKGKTEQKFRLGLGKQILVFSDPTTKAPSFSIVVPVEPIWKAWSIERVTAPKTAKGTYEKTGS